MDPFPVPIDVVTGIDALKRAIDTESTLRAAAKDEWARGEQNGPMRKAHDEVVKNVIAAARGLVARAGAAGQTG